MDELAIEAKSRMEKSLVALHNTFSTLRTGRANASLLDRIEVDYYGDKLPINQLAAISVPESRQLLIKPFSRDDIKAIITALGASDLGINPVNDGGSIRLVLPSLTEERRRDLAKQAKKFADDCKVSIRNIRHEYIDFLSADEYSEDLRKRILTEIQKVTDEAMIATDKAYKEKEVEILSV